MRINKYIAQNTEYSRRKADELILQQKVFLNNEKIISHATLIDPEKDKIEIKLEKKNIIISPNSSANKIYLALNKPAGYITTRSDEQNRKTVMELIPTNQNLKPVGRLDKDTEGLLLFSNDGDFINKQTHPKFECEKEYYAEVKGNLSDREKVKLENGIKIDNILTAPAQINIISRVQDSTIVRIIIHEGRNRQIRKMFDQLGHPVKYLKRIRIGKVFLDSLKTGNYRYLKKEEIYS